MSVRLATVDTWLRVLRTTRYLRGSQIACRLSRLAGNRLALQGLRARRRFDDMKRLRAPEESIPVVPEFSRGCSDSVRLTELLEQGELCLVNCALPLLEEAPDWRLGTQHEDRLWAITLHYHAWLYELSKLVGSDHGLAVRADVLFRSFLQDWLRVCTLGQPGVESLAWNSYAIATRLGWWARISHLLGKAYWEQHPELAERMLRSMYAQAVHLATHLEWDLRANHLLRDAVGLAWAGRFFQGNEPARWLKMATEIAVAQADEQMLVDGGHFERSPFYHLEVMDDWLSLAWLLPDDQASEKMLATWRRAAEYARWLCHPDGCVAQFNDGAAAAIAPHLSPGEKLIEKISTVSPRGGRWFEDSGVVTWHGDPWTLFWDVGEVGPDYQPGHAHADTLTIEASYHGHRLFVDPGCHSYDNNARRKYDRSTIAHNTVCIDQQDSSEVWHIFRMGRRARPVEVQAEIRPNRMSAAAAHDGYRHLSGRPRHHRAVDVSEHGPLRVRDRISGSGDHWVQGGWLLAPHWDATPTTNGWVLTCEQLSVRVTVDSEKPLNLAVVQADYHPDYCKKICTQRIQWDYQGSLPLEVCCSVARVS